MIIIGINGDTAHAPKRGSHDSGAALLVDGEIVAAANEERFSRIKQDDRYPFAAIAHVLAGSAKPELASLSWLSPRQQKPMLDRLFAHLYEESVNHPPLRRLYWKQQHSRWGRLLRCPKRTLPSELSGLNKEIHEHHLAHAASAYYCSPYENERTLVLTLDGQGDFAAGSLWLGEKGKLTPIEHYDALNSIGHLYAAFTGHLGFTPNRHEGKIVGLAAHGNPDLLCQRLLAHTRLGSWDRLFDAELILLTIRHWSEEGKAILARLTTGLSREDVAAGIQSFTEVVVTHLVAEKCRQHNCHLVAAAGGVFANVKMNQRIMELPEVENLYIHPNMGDGGLAAGAALASFAAARGGMTPKLLSTCYLGPDISDSDAAAAFAAVGLVAEKPENLAAAAADLLAAGKVVARAAGKMEYGPRALGNRTLFAACSDPAINKWLNDRLQRTEFMPFAPIVMEEYAAAYFPAWKPEHIAARFMTVTYDASHLAKEHIPAAIHIDGTARPQVLRREDNPEVYAILEAFHARTGVAALINTSFNMHEEPIVCSASDAVRAWQLGHLDALICGNLLCTGEKA